MRSVFGILSLGLVVMLASSAQAVVLKETHTWEGNGADCELRESSPTTVRCDNSEIASRIATGSRNSLIFLKFDVSTWTAADLKGGLAVQTHHRNNNLSVSRITDTVDPNNPNNGFDYYVLDPTIAGADWDPNDLSPAFATVNGLGYQADGNFDTKGTGTPGAPTAGLTYIGTKRYRDLFPSESSLPVGEAFNHILPAGSAGYNALRGAIETAQSEGHSTVTVAMSINHETSNPNGNWLNFNYLMQPEEFSGATAEAPSLLSIPEPTSLALLSLGSLALLRRRR